MTVKIWFLVYCTVIIQIF